MAIYKNGKNGILLKSDRKAVEVYKGSEKLFGYTEAESGAVVTVSDVHPVEHELKVKLRSKNLFDISTTEAAHGEVKDNSIVATNSGASFDVLLPAGTYTISFEKSPANFIVYLRNGRVNNGYFSSSANSSITFTYDASYDGYLRISHFGGGAILSNIQIEKGRTATEYTPYISDFSEVSVNRLGKNLFNWEEVAENGFIPSSYGTHIVKIIDGVITNNMGAYGAGVYAVTEPITLPAGNYVLSAKVMADKTEGNKNFWLGYFTDKIYNSAFELANYNAWEYHEYKFTLTEATPISQWRFQGGGQAGDYTNLKILFKDMCLTALADGEYEPYQKQITVSNPDGTVEGLTSLSPNMTLTADTDGVIIDCEYVKE